MCGIVGYVGKGNAADYLLDGLEILEYRGYDSAGLATLDNGSISVTKVVGRVETLKKAYIEGLHKSGLGIGHTRWATHGAVLQKNAHPHNSSNNEFSVIHNGIVENYQEIKKFLLSKGYKFFSDTDTEVVPNLIDYHFSKTRDVTKAFLAATKHLRGAYAIVMISVHAPNQLFAAKLASPLAIGAGKDEMFIGSDGLPMAGKAEKIVFLEDGEAAILTNRDYKIIDLKNDKTVDRAADTFEIEAAETDKGTYPDYMLKEIHEAPQTVRSSMLGRLKVEEGIIKLGGLENVDEQLRYIDRLVIIACGTSYYAGMVGEYLLEEIAGIPVEVQQASEFRYRKEPLSRNTAVLVISQSGETADAIAALKKLEGTGILRLGVVNAPGSTLARMTDAGVYCHAGPEKAVASTKAFIAQVTVLCLIALYLSKNYPGFKKMLKALDYLPHQLEQILSMKNEIKKVAKKYAHVNDFLYIGRRYLYPVALEGALKLKEISYIHAEGFAGGEMKHGPLALIDEKFPTFALALTSSITDKSSSNIQEIKARSGPIIAVTDDGKSEAAKLADDTILIPNTIEQLQPVLSATVTHLFAYYVARELKRDIDKPRNLAKSVTVE